MPSRSSNQSAWQSDNVEMYRLRREDLVDWLKKTFPGHGIMGEEHGALAHGHFGRRAMHREGGLQWRNPGGQEDQGAREGGTDHVRQNGPCRQTCCRTCRRTSGRQTCRAPARRQNGPGPTYHHHRGWANR